MLEIAGWIAPAATMIAAMMTAANLGARTTGWGFIVFTLGSVCWSVVGARTGQDNLLWTNVFLTLVNTVGIWRWLGRQARYADGSATAARKSAAARVPTLFSTSGVVGKTLFGAGGEPLGTVVDTMARCTDGQLAYVVVSEGGVGGVGEQLHALDPQTLVFTSSEVKSELSPARLKELPVLDDREWPIEFQPARS